MTEAITKELTGKVAIITGASRGIGAAAARELAAAGMKVVLAARTINDCEQIATDIRANGLEAQAVACDVTQYLSLIHI